MSSKDLYHNFYNYQDNQKKYKQYRKDQQEKKIKQSYEGINILKDLFFENVKTVFEKDCLDILLQENLEYQNLHKRLASVEKKQKIQEEYQKFSHQKIQKFIQSLVSNQLDYNREVREKLYYLSHFSQKEDWIREQEKTYIYHFFINIFREYELNKSIEMYFKIFNKYNLDKHFDELKNKNLLTSYYILFLNSYRVKSYYLKDNNRQFIAYEYLISKEKHIQEVENNLLHDQDKKRFFEKEKYIMIINTAGNKEKIYQDGLRVEEKYWYKGYIAHNKRQYKYSFLDQKNIYQTNYKNFVDFFYKTGLYNRFKKILKNICIEYNDHFLKIRESFKNTQTRYKIQKDYQYLIDQTIKTYLSFLLKPLKEQNTVELYNSQITRRFREKVFYIQKFYNYLDWIDSESIDLNDPYYKNYNPLVNYKNYNDNPNYFRYFLNVFRYSFLEGQFNSQNHLLKNYQKIIQKYQYKQNKMQTYQDNPHVHYYDIISFDGHIKRIWYKNIKSHSKKKILGFQYLDNQNNVIKE